MVVMVATEAAGLEAEARAAEATEAEARGAAGLVAVRAAVG